MKKLIPFCTFMLTSLFVCAQIEKEKKLVEKWEISPLFLKDSPILKSDKGYLDIDFAPDTRWELKIRQTGKPPILLHASNYIGKKQYGLLPGEYTIALNNIPIEKVPIEKNKKTRIRTGFLSIHFSVDGSPNAHGQILRQLSSGSSVGIGVDGSRIFAFPTGAYNLSIWGNFPDTVVTIGNKTTKEFSIEVGYRIIHSYDVIWTLYKMDGSYAHMSGGGAGHVSGGVRMPVGQYIIKWGGQSGTILFGPPNTQTIFVLD